MCTAILTFALPLHHSFTEPHSRAMEENEQNIDGKHIAQRELHKFTKYSTILQSHNFKKNQHFPDRRTIFRHPSINNINIFGHCKLDKNLFILNSDMKSHTPEIKKCNLQTCAARAWSVSFVFIFPGLSAVSKVTYPSV